MDVMIDKVIMFAIIIVISFAATKLGWLGDNVREGISRLIARITGPLLIFTSFSSLNSEENLFKEAIIVVLVSAVIILFLHFLAKLYVKAARLDEETKNTQIPLMTFGNVGFLAYPLFEAVFGAIGVFYGAFYHLVNDTLFWTYGVAGLGSNLPQSIKGKLSRLLNNNTVAVFLGIIFMALQIKIPPVILEPITGLGKTTVYLSFVFVGVAMAGVDLAKTYKRLSVYAVVVVKMLAVPLLAAVFLIRINSFGLSQSAINSVVLQAAMPSMIMISIMASELKGNYKFASETVFMTTVISLLTIPLVYKFIEILI